MSKPLTAQGWPYSRAMDNPSAGPAELRTPRAAAVAGIAFAVILGTVIVLARSSTLAQGVDPTTWLNPQSRRTSVEVALYLVPFAGIAFLWFIGVLRSRLGAAEDRLFATVFLGSGLLFVASLFVATAALSAILQLAPPGGAVPTESVKLLATFSAVFSGEFATRMAAVFTLAVTTAGRRAKLLPGWLVAIGYVFPVALLISPEGMPWIVILFPTWVLLLSLHILIANAGGSTHPESVERADRL